MADRVESGPGRLRRLGKLIKGVLLTHPIGTAGWLVAVIACVGWRMRLQPIDTTWGDVSTAVAGAGTLAALAWAIRVFYLERGERQSAQKREAAADQRARAMEAQRRVDERRSQASQIVWWAMSRGSTTATASYVGVEWVDDTGQVADPHPSAGSWCHRRPEATLPVSLYLQNRSESPVRNFVVSSGIEDRTMHFVGVLPPGTWIYDEVTADPTGGSSSTYRILVDIANGAPVSWVEFVDSNQVLWRRYPDGTLVERDGEPIDPQKFSL